MNKKIWGILGATVLTLSVTTQLSFANEQESTSNMQVAAYSVRSQANANQIINFAKQQLGKPYVWGATGPNSFDCSGFIYYVFSQNGYGISRTSVAGYWGDSSIQKVSTAKAGDLIFFKGTYGGTNNPSHIGIMINDSEFIHAGDNGVAISNKNSSYWSSHFLGYGSIIPAESTKTPIYRVETGGFVGIEKVKSEAALLKSQFGWNGVIKDNKSDNKYRIETGGFSYDRAKYELTFLKGHFGWDGVIKDNKSTNTYRIETGGFSHDRAEYELTFLKGHFGWDGVIEANGDKPNEYKIVINGFTGEDAVKDAQKRLEAATGWWTTYVGNDSNEYKIVIDWFTGEDAVKDAQKRLEAATGWWTTYVGYDSNEYKIVINGFEGESSAKDAQRKLQELGCWSTYVFTGEYK
ncbi:C40 family peptidase [Paraclostridium bifermentans]|nr:NlpC/P60 family protein [Paraclostridium bifermentans]MBN8047407.1 C40 family peptidase [Paraclostridium bifermentans]